MVMVLCHGYACMSKLMRRHTKYVNLFVCQSDLNKEAFLFFLKFKFLSLAFETVTSGTQPTFLF